MFKPNFENQEQNRGGIMDILLDLEKATQEAEKIIPKIQKDLSKEEELKMLKNTVGKIDESTAIELYLDIKDFDLDDTKSLVDIKFISKEEGELLNKLFDKALNSRDKLNIIINFLIKKKGLGDKKDKIIERMVENLKKIKLEKKYEKIDNLIERLQRKLEEDLKKKKEELIKQLKEDLTVNEKKIKRIRELEKELGESEEDTETQVVIIKEEQPEQLEEKDQEEVRTTGVKARKVGKMNLSNITTNNKEEETSTQEKKENKFSLEFKEVINKLDSIEKLQQNSWKWIGEIIYNHLQQLEESDLDEKDKKKLSEKLKEIFTSFKEKIDRKIRAIKNSEEAIKGFLDLKEKIPEKLRSAAEKFVKGQKIEKREFNQLKKLPEYKDLLEVRNAEKEKGRLFNELRDLFSESLKQYVKKIENINDDKAKTKEIEELKELLVSSIKDLDLDEKRFSKMRTYLGIYNNKEGKYEKIKKELEKNKKNLGKKESVFQRYKDVIENEELLGKILDNKKIKEAIEKKEKELPQEVINRIKEENRESYKTKEEEKEIFNLFVEDTLSLRKGMGKKKETIKVKGKVKLEEIEPGKYKITELKGENLERKFKKGTVYLKNTLPEILKKEIEKIEKVEGKN